MSKKCSQCGNAEAIYKMGEHLLCLNCTQKIKQMNHMDLVANMQMVNFLSGHMDSMVGLCGISPKFQIPEAPPTINQQGDITLNNINVEKSVIGSINTGNIGQIEVALSNIRNGGDDELAKNIKEFTEAVLASTEITIEMKNEIIEQLSFLSGQATVPKESQKGSIIKPILSTIGKGIQHIPSLLTLFEKLGPFFGL
jgi:hypothetical protein